MLKRTKIQSELCQLPGYQCFACAPRELNPAGLDLVFEATPEGARTVFCVKKQFESYPGFLHGGIVTTILDETMAYAWILKRKTLPFTKSLQVKFRHAVRAEANFFCVASVMAETEGGYSARASIKNERGAVFVLAEGEFILPTTQMANRMMGGGYRQKNAVHESHL